MNHRMIRWLAAVLLAVASTLFGVHAEQAPGLTETNFVEVGDSVADLLNTSGLAFATLGMVSAPARRARPRPAAWVAAHPALPALTFSSPCPGGGSLRGSLRDEDRSGGLSTGDRFATVFESCVVDASVVTGRSEFTVAVHRFEASVEITELEFHFHELGSPELRWSGPAHVVLRTDQQRGTEHFVVTYRDLAVQRGPRKMRWDFSLDVTRPPIGSSVASLRGAITFGELRLQLQQDEPYVIHNDGFPRSGQLSAGDDHGARLEVEAGRWRYTYRFFRAGNSGLLPDSTSQSRPYGSA